MDVVVFPLFFLFQINAGFFRLTLQRSDLTLQLCENIIDTHQILALTVQFLLRRRLSALVFHDACRLVEQLTPLLGATA